VVVVTSDKCYLKPDSIWGHREKDRLGGYDPYSSSKACAEVVSHAYNSSYFNTTQVATARAGNVIGGGDWAEDRLVPDCVRAYLADGVVTIRNQKAIRPWQHVLEPLSGYLLLARKLCEEPHHHNGPLNFGPDIGDMQPVERILDRFVEELGVSAIISSPPSQLKETFALRLDNTAARVRLGWKPKWDLDKALDSIVEWVRAYQEGKDMREVTMGQIEEYMG